jgi:phage terminase large subunit
MLPVQIQLPHKFDPRAYQLPLLAAMDRGYLRAVCLWHRRAGKDKCLCNFVSKKMMERVGAYYYFFPTYKQGKKILWDGMDRDGFKFTDHFPKELRFRTDNTEMLIQYVHPVKREADGKPSPGSIFQVIGTDKIDSIVGTNPVGAVFSEYALQDPAAWDFIRPILAENGGWAIFNYTPRGHNRKTLWDMARKNPDVWFTQKLTVDDTKVIPPAVLEAERQEMLEQTGHDGLFMQEYYVSFDAPVQGAYYGRQMIQAERDGRITNVPWEASLPVDTYWDLGMDDSMTIWFVQSVGREVRLIDYLENNGEGLQFYAKELAAKPYTYGRHHAPHDIEVRELGTGASRRDTARKLGLSFQVVPNLGLEDGIDAARNLIPKCWFDQRKCERGINALNSYEKEWDEKNKVYKSHPLHNWASHGADAFRYVAVGYKPPRDEPEAHYDSFYH